MALKKRLNKSAFVRSLPDSLSAKEVVAKGKEAGITLTPAYVYTIRSASKRSGSGPKRGPGRPKGSGSLASINKGAGVVVKAGGSLKNAEAQIMEWILEYGAPAVTSAIDNVKARLRGLV